MTPPTCPYCNNAAKLVDGRAIYNDRPDLAYLKYWRCKPCNASVGCHKFGAFLYVDNRRVYSDGTLPLGRLANPQLRAAKREAHLAFDPLWRDMGMRRQAAYNWLANAMDLPLEKTHIGEFDVAQCRQVIALCLPRKAA